MKMTWVSNDPLAVLDLTAADAAYSAAMMHLRTLRLPIPEHAQEVKRLRAVKSSAYAVAGVRGGVGE